MDLFFNMDCLHQFLFFIVSSNAIKPWIVESSTSPVIYYSYANIARQLKSGHCNPLEISNSTFEFGNTGRNILELPDTSVFKLLLLKCVSEFPIHWMAIKPLGSIEYFSNEEVNRFDHDPFRTQPRRYFQYLFIKLGANFSRTLRCETYSDLTLAAEVFLNSPPSGFPLWDVARKMPTRFPVNTRGSTSGQYILPCVAERFHGNYSLKFIKIHPDGGPTGLVSENCANCICRASSDCVSYPCNSTHVCGKLPKSYWGKTPPKNIHGCKGNFSCARNLMRKYLETILGEKDCDGDGIVSCKDYGQIHLQRNKGQCEGNHTNLTVALSTAEFANCLVEARENFTIVTSQPGDYDPRIGLKLHHIPDLQSKYECNFDSDFYASYKLSLSISVPGQLNYNISSGKFSCGAVRSSQNRGHPNMTFGKCKSLIHCQLQFAPMVPAVFTEKDGLPEDQFQEVVLDSKLPNNGFKSDYNHGFAQCYGIYFNPSELLGQTDYFFTGMDKNLYLISSPFPAASVITIQERIENLDRFYRCKISTFVLLPNIVFVVESKTGEQHQCRRQNGSYVKVIHEDESHATLEWELELNASLETNNVTCYSPWINSSEWAQAQFIRNVVKQAAAQDPGDNFTIHITGCALVGVAVFLAMVAFFFRKMLRRLPHWAGQNPPSNRNCSFTYRNGVLYAENQTESLMIMQGKLVSSSELKMDDIVHDEGRFGSVRRGTMSNKRIEVKSCKPNADFEYFKEFAKELEMLSCIGEHENVVRFHGAVLEGIHSWQLQAVLEISDIGNLNCYLRNTTTNCKSEQMAISPSILISFCKQIASGMEFLSSKEVIHGDLAARNVLVFNSNVVKLTNFGLPRKQYDYSIDAKKDKATLPWRWMALESLRSLEFSTNSDVWSLGITVWEIFSLGRVPYSGHVFSDDFIDRIESGYRLLQPDLAPDVVFEWMKMCWTHVVDDRPTFLRSKEFFINIESSVNIADDIYGVVTGPFHTENE